MVVNQKTWLTEITEVCGDSVWALLSDAEHDWQPVEVVQIPCTKINYQPLLPGMVFWWHIDGDAGTSEFRPQEIMSKCWTQEQVDSYKMRAKEMAAQLNAAARKL